MQERIRAFICVDFPSEIVKEVARVQELLLKKKFAGKVNGKPIYDLQKQVDDKLFDLGFAKEERFMSHLTVARIKFVKDIKGFYEHVCGINVKDLKFKVGEFKLMKSELSRMGPSYEVLERFRLSH